ncbi:MAG TPA: hypothetical protein VNZ22_21230, partial [Bacillota bacterium]|nr:hypothetical protein [Bacillota bacterium]
ARLMFQQAFNHLNGSTPMRTQLSTVKARLARPEPPLLYPFPSSVFGFVSAFGFPPVISCQPFASLADFLVEAPVLRSASPFLVYDLPPWN